MTPRSFSVVWASDVPIDDATLDVFSDAAGTNEITGSSRCASNPALACTNPTQCGGSDCLPVTASLTSPPQARTNGVVKVTVTGVGPGQTYYFRIQTTVGGTTASDGSAPRAVTTPQRPRLAGAGALAVVGDLVRFEVRDLPMTGSAPGALLIADADGAAYPVSAFPGEGFALPTAVVNLANLYDATGQTLALVGDELLEVIEFRGILAGNITKHRLHHFRKVPSHEEEAALGVRLAELEPPGDCFDACDFDCNDAVSIGDFFSFLGAYPSVKGQSVFNPDFDLTANGAISVSDFFDFLGCYPRTRM